MLAVATSLAGLEARVLGQESEGTTAADAEQTSQAAAEETTDTQSQQPNAEPTAQASASAEAGTDQSAASADSTANTSDSAAGETPTSNAGTSSVPPPDPQREVQAGAAQSRDQATQRQDRPAGNQHGDDAQQSGRGTFDAAARGRAELDARHRSDRTHDIDFGIRFGAVAGRGLTIQTIEQDSLFFDSGLRRGDVVLSVYGRPLRSEMEFVRFIRRYPGQRIPVIVLRDGRHETIYITYRQDAFPAEPPVAYGQQPVGSQAYLGVTFEAQVPNGALVRSVVPDSPAAHAGLRAGDMIVALNGEPVSTYRDAIEVISMMRPGDRMAISFSRRIENETQALLAARPGTTVHTAARPTDASVYSDAAPAPTAEPQRIEVGPGDVNNRPQPLDRDRPADRPVRDRLLPRLLD
jgi:hypothetical protein